MHQIISLEVYIWGFTVFSEEPSSHIATKEMGAIDAKQLRTSTPFFLE